MIRRLITKIKLTICVVCFRSPHTGSFAALRHNLVTLISCPKNRKFRIFLYSVLHISRKERWINVLRAGTTLTLCLWFMLLRLLALKILVSLGIKLLYCYLRMSSRLVHFFLFCSVLLYNAFDVYPIYIDGSSLYTPKTVIIVCVCVTENKLTC